MAVVLAEAMKGLVQVDLGFGCTEPPLESLANAGICAPPSGILLHCLALAWISVIASSEDAPEFSQDTDSSVDRFI